MNNLLQSIEVEVRVLFSQKLDSKYAYHNFGHTEKVVRECVNLAEAMSLSDEEKEKLLIAAWFHDTGYTEGQTDHEQRSIANANAFLTEHNYDPKAIEDVCAAILATKYPQKPITELGEVLCDADLSGIGSDDYLDSTVHLRTEMSNTCDKQLTEIEWIKGEIRFLTEHKYITKAGRALYKEQKQQNISKLKKMKEDLSEDKPSNMDEGAEKPVEKSKKKSKLKAYSRGVETMFRTAARTHINLSSMADSKANIMLSINAMIVSVVLTVLVPKLDSNRYLIIPAGILLFTCLGAMILATLSTRPIVSSGKSNLEDIRNKRSNLLFFGNFHDMKLDEYEWGMKQMMGNNDFLYSSLTRDLYFLGKVLNKKYAYLRLCYNIFMYGMIASVLAFGVALVIV